MAPNEAVAAAAVTMRSGELFSTGGAVGSVGTLLSPHWHWSPHWQPASEEVLLEQQLVFGWQQELASLHRQTFSPVQEHWLATASEAQTVA